MDDKLIDIFREEATDLIERIRTGLQGFLQSANQAERFNDILRAIHTIKGGAGVSKLHKLKEAAHHLETDLGNYRSNLAGVTAEKLRFIENSVDQFETMIEVGEESATASSHPTGLTLFDETPQQPVPNVINSQDSVSRAAPVQAAGEMLRVPMERVQNNFDTVSEIFLIRNQMSYLVEQFRKNILSAEEFFQRFEMMDNSMRKSIGSLEQIAVSMRMMPIKSVLKRMEKTIRGYTSENQGKDIRVELVGEEIEMDKKILDGLSEPLIHLTRNAMDHGIETIEERKIKGKQQTAVIRFEVVIAGNEVEIKVSDDGKGIDEHKILASAKRKGMDVSSLKTKSEMIDLIFMPGFSTAEKVSDVSGRGIGMDAVRSYVESMGGSISIKTELGRGTDFILRLPLGVSVIPVTIARIYGQIFAISNHDLLETRRIATTEIVLSKGKHFYRRGDDFIPCYNLEKYLYQEFRPTFLTKPRSVLLCVIRSGSKTIAMTLGELIANVEIAVKRVTNISGGILYISGVAVLATGEPTFVLSLSRLYEKVIRPSELIEKGAKHAA